MVEHPCGYLRPQTPNPIKGYVVMATDKFTDFVRAVNSALESLLVKATAIYRPVMRLGETYSLAQARIRVGVAQKTLKAWEADGLPIARPIATKKCFIRSDDLIEYLARSVRINKTE